VLALYAILFLALVSASFLEGFFYLTPENQYHRGPLYQLILLPLIAIQLLTFAGVIKRRKRLSRKVFFAFLIAILPIAVAVTVLLFVDFLPLFGFSHVLSALAVYSLILSDQIEQDRRRQQEIIRQQQKIARQQQEIAQERASVMVLQMRPHFIYNTLVSIHSLCRLDPRKAQQVTLDFTNYLRRNFSAVSSDKNISFSTELEHTRAYLAVEQVRFEGKLFVELDTPFTNFRLPPLTLQPIVENAVKHGVSPELSPLYVSVYTREASGGVELIVEDTGPGFDPAAEETPHSALDNIRQRLDLLCGGTLTIAPRDAGGTKVTIFLPL
jgi:LytS/YehU family sensor histidine kinase